MAMLPDGLGEKGRIDKLSSTGLEKVSTCVGKVRVSTRRKSGLVFLSAEEDSGKS